MRNYLLKYLPLIGLTAVAEGQDFFHPVEETPSVWVTAHLNVAAGASSGEIADLTGHEHDPNDELTLQSLDVGLNVNVTDHLSTFVNGILFLDEEDNIEVELEEAFFKYDFTSNFGIRGGRLLNRIGIQNDRHLHSWDFVDANFTTFQFLGEEGLITDSIEVNWVRQGLQWTTSLTASYGQAGGEEEEEGGEGEEGDELPGAGESFLGDDTFTSRALFIYQQDDFNKHTLGLNAAFGDNGFSRNTQIFSADYAYNWREKGLEPDGRHLTAGVEYFYRDVEWVNADNENLTGSTGQSSYMAYVLYGFAKDWVLGLRYEFVEGVEAGEALGGDFTFATDERQRATIALTRFYTLNDDWSGFARLQYNHDDISGEGRDDSVFLQLGLNLGSSEIR